MSERLYLDTPYPEPKGFWRRVWWWLRKDYLLAEDWLYKRNIMKDVNDRLRLALNEAIDTFHYGLRFTAPELVEMRIDQLRERVNDALESEELHV